MTQAPNMETPITSSEAGTRGRMTRPDEAPMILGLGGTMRPGSTSEKALRAALTAASASGARTVLMTAAELDLPMYAPAATGPSAAKLIANLRACDGVVVSSPGYHGSMSGMIKNALDYAEGLRSTENRYLDGRAFGCIACAAGWQAAASTLGALRSVAHALRAWPTPLGVALNSVGTHFDAAGRCEDEAIQQQLERVGIQVVEFALMRRALAKA